MKKALLIFFIATLTSVQSFSQGLVEWMSIEEAEKKAKENPKPILVDIYTDWCGWCKKMLITTYSDPQVANFVNSHFYPVAFDAETRDTIEYQGETYINTESGARATHQLTYKFLPKSRSYPSTIFMTGDMQNSVLVPGYLDSKTIAPILVYYKEKLYTDANINDFMAYFDSTFTPGNAVKAPSEVKWVGLQEALNKNKKAPKKIFVHLFSPDCISCKVMDSTTYTDPKVADFLNESYYPVKFDVTSKDTIDILNQKLVNTGTYHQLPLAALKNKMEFPAVLIFNEKNELLTPVPQYMTPGFMEAVLTYFKEDLYAKQKFPEFYQEFTGQSKQN